MTTGEDDKVECDGIEGRPPPASREQPPPSAEEMAASKARREAAAARIRDIRRKGQERIDRTFAEHLADHGKETETSAEDFLREIEGNAPPKG